MYGVLAEILPFGFAFVNRWNESGNWPGMVDLFGRGDLLLSSIILAVAGMGESISTLLHQQVRGSRWILGFIFSLLAVVGTAGVAYGSASSREAAAASESAGRQLQGQRVRTAEESLILLAGTVISDGLLLKLMG